MDKQTLSNYGWLIIVVLVLSVMIALATPFGTYVKEGAKSTLTGLFESSENALNTGLSEAGVSVNKAEFDGVPTVDNDKDFDEIDLSTVSNVLENNDWATISAVVKAGKAKEVGWKVGDTKTLTYNNSEYTVRIIGFDHDAQNSITFMFTEKIGKYYMNAATSEYTSGHNIGGYADSDMRVYLENTVYNALDNDVKSVIKTVTKTYSCGSENPENSNNISCNLFLLSIKETNLLDVVKEAGKYPYINTLETEGNVYEWFENNTLSLNTLSLSWLRSSASYGNENFFYYDYNAVSTYASNQLNVFPAFVIG